MKPRRSPLRTSSAVIALLVVCGWSVRAANTVTIVLVGDASPAFMRELSAEATEVGLTVTKGGAHEDPERALVERDAVAVLRIVPPSRVEVWFKKSEDRGTVASHELLAGSGAESEPFAARIVEQVRAHLVRLALLPEPRASRRETAALPKKEPEPADRDSSLDRAKAGPHTLRRLLWLAAGVGGTVATGGVPGTVQALVGLRAAPGPFEVEAFGLLPLANGDVTGKEGRAEITAMLFGAHADYILGESAPLQGALGVGGGALLLSMHGEAMPPYSGHDESVATGAFFVDGSVRRQVTDWLGLRLWALGGVCAPRPVVTFSGRDVATWGRTFGTLVAAVEFGAPISTGAP